MCGFSQSSSPWCSFSLNHSFVVSLLLLSARLSLAVCLSFFQVDLSCGQGLDILWCYSWWASLSQGFSLWKTQKRLNKLKVSPSEDIKAHSPFRFRLKFIIPRLLLVSKIKEFFWKLIKTLLQLKCCRLVVISFQILSILHYLRWINEVNSQQNGKHPPDDPQSRY